MGRPPHESDGHEERTMVMARQKPSGKNVSYTLPGDPTVYHGREEVPHEHLYSVQEANGTRLYDVKRTANPSDVAAILCDAMGKPVMSIARTHFCRSCMSFGVYEGHEIYDDSSLLLVMEMKFFDNSLAIADPQNVIADPGAESNPRQARSAPTFKVHRSTLGSGLTVLRNDAQIAKVKRKINLSSFAGENTYRMKIQQKQDESLVLSIVAIFDMMKSPSFSASDDSPGLDSSAAHGRRSVHHTCWDSHHSSPAYLFHQRPPAYGPRYGGGHGGYAHGSNHAPRGAWSGGGTVFGYTTTASSDSGFSNFGYCDTSGSSGMSSSGFSSSGGGGGGCDTSSSSTISSSMC